MDIVANGAVVAEAVIAESWKSVGPQHLRAIGSPASPATAAADLEKWR